MSSNIDGVNMASQTNTENTKEETGKSVPIDITTAVANAKTAKTKFAVLKTLIEAVEISDRDILDTVFNLVSPCSTKIFTGSNTSNFWHDIISSFLLFLIFANVQDNLEAFLCPNYVYTFYFFAEIQL